jgi:hypothetical protein
VAAFHIFVKIDQYGHMGMPATSQYQMFAHYPPISNDFPFLLQRLTAVNKGQ